MNPDMDLQSGETIGRQLARLREARGLPVAKVAEDLRCDRKIIEALEADRYAELGAAVFARGHLRRYADLLGAPTAELLARWSAEQGAAQPLPDLTRAPQAPRPLDTRRWGRLLAMLAGALAIGLAAWWILQGAGVRSAAAPSVTAPPPATTAPQAVPVPQAVPLPPASTPAGQTATPDAAEPAAPPLAPVAEPAAPASQPASPSASQPASPPVAVAPGDLSLVLSPGVDCWAEVVDARGERRVYRIIRAGERISASGTPPLRVTLGRGDVTRLEIGGRAADIPADAIRDAVARFEIAASGAMRALPPQPVPGVADAAPADAAAGSP